MQDEGFHSASSHPSMLQELPSEDDRSTGAQHKVSAGWEFMCMAAGLCLVHAAGLAGMAAARCSLAFREPTRCAAPAPLAGDYRQQRKQQQRAEQQQGGVKSGTASVATAALASSHKPSQRELELLLHAELRAANEALCTVTFPGGWESAWAAARQAGMYKTEALSRWQAPPGPDAP